MSLIGRLADRKHPFNIRYTKVRCKHKTDYANTQLSNMHPSKFELVALTGLEQVMKLGIIEIRMAGNAAAYVAASTADSFRQRRRRSWEHLAQMLKEITDALKDTHSVSIAWPFR